MNDMKQHFHESNLIEGFDDPEFDRQQYVAWEYLKKQKELNQSVVCRVQKILTLRQTDLKPNERGHYRTTPVYIGGHAGMHPEYLKPLMDSWFLDVEGADPKKHHVRFEKIHPFIDGNGRTGRQLMWWMEIKQGKKPTLIKDSEKQEYYKWFQ